MRLLAYYVVSGEKPKPADTDAPPARREDASTFLRRKAAEAAKRGGG